MRAYQSSQNFGARNGFGSATNGNHVHFVLSQNQALGKPISTAL
jgi:hypothetical protein